MPIWLFGGCWSVYLHLRPCAASSGAGQGGALLRNHDGRKVGEVWFCFPGDVWQTAVMHEEPVILGEGAFAAISAVEGIYLSSNDKAQLAAWREAGLSNDEIRKRVAAHYSGREAA